MSHARELRRQQLESPSPKVPTLKIPKNCRRGNGEYCKEKLTVESHPVNESMMKGVLKMW